MRAAGHLADHHADEVGIVPPGAQQDLGDPAQLLVGGLVGLLDPRETPEQLAPVLAEERRKHLFLGGEVVVEQAVRDTGFLRDVADARGVVAVAGEDAHGGVDDEASLLLTGGLPVAARTLARD